MKLLNKKDCTNILVLVSIFFIIIFTIVGIKYVNGSTVDWNSQHWVIPEYFRNLYYDTHDIFPSFAFNLGAGENIYNLSYYGFLNPLLLISYLLPNVRMVDYIIVMMMVVVVLSIFFMYYFLRKRFNSKYSFVGTLLFLLSGPIIYHTHRHIMFINYMPFLILALIGIDNYFDKNKKVLLIISTFLIIMTSYYYSVGSLICITCYAIYKYLELNDKIVFKQCVKDSIKFILIMCVPILMSCVLTLPTLYALLNGRNNITDMVSIYKMLTPTVDLNQILYNAYTMGVTSIIFLAIALSLSLVKKENKFLSLIFVLVIIFPIFIYALSGFMYYRGKVLIPFLPLAILLIVTSINNISIKDNKRFIVIFTIFSVLEIVFYIYSKTYIFILDVIILYISYLIYKKKANKNIIIYPLCVTALLCCIVNNLQDTYVTKENINRQYDMEYYNKITSIINKDENLYRMGNDTFGIFTSNRVVNTNYYLPSIYSSVENKNYFNFVNNMMGSEMSERIATAILPSKNIMFNTYMGTKYIMTNTNPSVGYEKVYDNIYVNENVYPIGYASSNIINKATYDALSYPDNIYALLTNIVVDDDSNNVGIFDSKVLKENLNLDVTDKNVKIKSDDNYYTINSNDNGYINLNLNKTFQNKILFISFDMSYSEYCSVGDTSITINDVKNTLSCREYIYHNKNNNFTYVISSNEDITSLNVKFTKGKYVISNINIYSLDYEYITSSVGGVDEFKINKEMTSGDTIIGEINVNENSYFKLSIPYDKGFNVYLDGEKIEYEKVDNAFIGFPIHEGNHIIKVSYASPYLLIGLILSMIGDMIFLPIIYADKGKKED